MLRQVVRIVTTILQTVNYMQQHEESTLLLTTMQKFLINAHHCVLLPVTAYRGHCRLRTDISCHIIVGRSNHVLGFLTYQIGCTCLVISVQVTLRFILSGKFWKVSAVEHEYDTWRVYTEFSFCKPEGKYHRTCTWYLAYPHIPLATDTYGCASSDNQLNWCVIIHKDHINWNAEVHNLFFEQSVVLETVGNISFLSTILHLYSQIALSQ
jgi:hypothetical protein